MVAPGPVVLEHAAIANDCFACHTPFMGASPDRCTDCHKVAQIGVRTTKGETIPSHGRKVAFHQALAQADCMACHSDHAGPRLVKTAKRIFAHDLLKPEVQTRCAACHRAPATQIHAQAGNSCAQCHTQKAWKPATFNHTRFFALTGPHNAACTTCHTGGKLSTYTCYDCHEHQPGQIRAEHAEEGIRDIDNCTRCHRSASDDGDGERGRTGRGDD
ncbi:cytochrome c3 family protein [Novosphingobium sp.]|uniref:cytochrome c3 family protein n=1 Tax=Novosphingobium sp. TaxID=1874826 RepID=UPI0034575245